MRKVFMLSVLLLCLSSLAWSQTRKVEGNVKGENGTPIAGASITLKGTNKGTFTNADGKFSIEVSSTGKSVLIVNSIGFTAQEISVGNLGVLSIQLVSENKQLEDVVVVGYGAVRKKDLTGAVGSLSTEI